MKATLTTDESLFIFRPGARSLIDGWHVISPWRTPAGIPTPQVATCARQSALASELTYSSTTKRKSMQLTGAAADFAAP
jgi:hypothetical protein